MKIVKDPPSQNASTDAKAMVDKSEGQGKIQITELKEMAEKMHGFFVKAIVDIEKNIIAFDAPMHSDLFELLIQEENSEPVNLWGINIHPEQTGENFIEFDSMMNIKPRLGNKTRGIENKEVREKIIKIVDEIVQK